MQTVTGLQVYIGNVPYQFYINVTLCEAIFYHAELSVDGYRLINKSTFLLAIAFENDFGV